MKVSKRALFFGTVILFIFIVSLSVQLSKNLQPEEALTEDFFKSDTNLSLEKVNYPIFKEIDVSKEVQNEIKRLVSELNLKRTDKSYGPTDADYRIVSIANQDDQLYLFADENVIVFPNENSTGYSIKSNDEFMKTIDMLLN